MDFYLHFFCLATLTLMVNASNLTPVDKKYQMPSSCEGENICLEKGADYPDDLVNDVLEGFDNIDMIGMPMEFADRQGYLFQGSCSSEDCVTTCSQEGDLIYYIKDVNDQVRIVLQSKGNFTQIVPLRWCENEGPITQSTKNIINPDIVNISCVTKYMDFEFFVLSEDYSKIERARPMNGIPVCCMCRTSVIDY